MTSLITLFTLVTIAVHVAAFGFLIAQSTRLGGVPGWLAITILSSGFALSTFLSNEEYFILSSLGRNIPLTILSAFTLIAFGNLTQNDIKEAPLRPLIQQYWSRVGAIWIVAIILSAILSDSFVVGQQNWLKNFSQTADLSVFVTTIGYLILGGALFGYELHTSYHTPLPGIANRALFWALESVVLLAGMFLIMSGFNLIILLGMIIWIIGILGAVYAKTYYHVFDIRSGIIILIKTIAFVGIAGAITFIIMYLVVSNRIETDAEGILLLALLSAFIASFYIPIHQFIEYTVLRITYRSLPNPAQVTREYNQVISQAVELNQLIVSATHTLNRILQVRQSRILLLNSTIKVKDAVELIVMNNEIENPDKKSEEIIGYLAYSSPLYETLAIKRKPLSQFDLEYGPEYHSANSEELTFFRELKLSAYAPIIQENAFIGILAVGEKFDETAFYPRDLDLLAILAQQTGVAVRNARLVDDLQHLNRTTRSLNRTLKGTNVKLERMDNVKTDFVTIASHELRTPLAQIRGYTDIIDALNDQGMLDSDQTGTLVTNLRKATERMEELISAMLDVSQLDVDAMDLRFTETSLETIIKLSIEPMTDAIKARRLALSARGFRGLPTIQADLQRLVQAFRNIIVNSIKFTPDGGRIEIIAAFQEKSDTNGTPHILVTITDTGVGIDQKNLEMVFNKFFRAYDPSLHSTGATKFLGAGPGLGLTIAKGVIEGHGGKIWAESSGQDMISYPGSTFYVLLPIDTPKTARRILSFEGDSTARP